MILLALLAAQAGPSAVEAERAFAADAARLGQWTAFRKWAADDAVMFAPQPVNAQAFLKDRKDPPKSVDWWPTASFVSCDGSLAVNTGGWRQPDGSVGYFTTVWQRQADGGWKWIVDGGDGLSAPRERAGPAVRKASCEPVDLAAADLVDATSKHAEGRSPDRSLAWSWTVDPRGARRFTALIWTGTALEPVVTDEIAAPK